MANFGIRLVKHKEGKHQWPWVWDLPTRKSVSLNEMGKVTESL